MRNGYLTYLHSSSMTKIPQPTADDMKRDAEADYKWIATSTGQMFANIAASYIRLYVNAETCFRTAMDTIDELRDDLGHAEEQI